MKVRTVLAFIFLACSFTGLLADARQDEHIRTAIREFLADDAEDAGISFIARLEGIGGVTVNDIFESYRLGTLYLWNGQMVFTDGIVEDENYEKQMKPVDIFTRKPVGGKDLLVPLKEVTVFSAGRAERKALSSAKTLVELSLPDTGTVLAAIRRISSDERKNDALPILERLYEESPSGKIRKTAGESASIIRLQNPEDTKGLIKAAKILGEIRSLRSLPFLEELVSSGTSADTYTQEELAVVHTAIRRIRSYQGIVNVFDIIKSSISTGSILILMALGLAITFGMMGVINMAHGEIMMIGAYTTYCVQLLFGHTAETPHPLFFAAALPLSFLAAALTGGFIEWAVVKRLYKRPYESLLATYGISMVLVQLIRLMFGDNRATNSPLLLQGAIEVAQGMAIPVNRIFIFAVAAACVGLVWAIMRYTDLGLKMRATMQNRDMASAMGINTRKVDSYTFMLGSGIAGIAGYALTTIGGITPDMGKNYIVDSFLIVVTGGVGSVAGVASSGMAIGFINKILEGTFLGTVWAKIIVLVLVMAFIQFKPSGLFAPKGRLADE